jgi:hypothetical protein
VGRADVFCRATSYTVVVYEQLGLLQLRSQTCINNTSHVSAAQALARVYVWYATILHLP